MRPEPPDPAWSAAMSGVSRTEPRWGFGAAGSSQMSEWSGKIGMPGKDPAEGPDSAWQRLDDRGASWGFRVKPKQDPWKP